MTRALSEAQRTALNAQIPLGRLGLPADIAAAVAFLLADGGYITGRDPARERRHVHGLSAVVRPQSQVFVKPRRGVSGSQIWPRR